MADKKVVIKVTDQGLKETIADAEKLNRLLDEAAKKSTKIGGGTGTGGGAGASQKKAAKATRDQAEATDKLNKSQGENYRHSQGVANNSSNLTKNFSKQAQGLGGLIHVYATVAAHAFAVTAAFTLLKTAMDTSIVIKGLEEMGASSGTNLRRMAEGFKEVTGHAISTAQAMRTVSFASSAGMSGKEINNLGKIARGASIGLGRDLGDAVDRLTRGVAKLEPEILDELGIIVRVDKASKAYADTLGKTVAQLTIAEKRQAFLNATQEQGLSKWGELADTVDPNVYDRVAKAMEDLTHNALEFINTVVSPVLEFFSSSPKALMAVMVFMANFIAKKASHTWADFSNVMREKVATASEAATKSLSHMREELVVLQNTKFDLSKIGTAKGGDILKKYGQELKINSKVIGGIFNDPNINGDAFVTKLKKQGPRIKTALTQAYKALNTGKGTAKFLGAEVTRAELKQIELYITKLGITTKLTAKEMEASMAGAATVIGARWKVVTAGIVAGFQSAKAAVVGFAATAGGVLSKLLGPISWVMLAWSYLEDEIRNALEAAGLLDKGTDVVKATMEKLSEEVEHSTKVIGKYSKALESGTNSVADWAARFSTASNLIKNFSSDYEKVVHDLNNASITGNEEEIEETGKHLATLINNYKKLKDPTITKALENIISQKELKSLEQGNLEIDGLRNILNSMRPALESASLAVKNMGENMSNFAEAMSKVNKAFREFSRDGLKTTPYDNLIESILGLNTALEDTESSGARAHSAAVKATIKMYSDKFGKGDVEAYNASIDAQIDAIDNLQAEKKRARKGELDYKKDLVTANQEVEASEKALKEAREGVTAKTAAFEKPGVAEGWYIRDVVWIEAKDKETKALAKLEAAKQKVADKTKMVEVEQQNQKDAAEQLVKATLDLTDASNRALKESGAAAKRKELIDNYKFALSAQKDLLKYKFEEKQAAAIKFSTKAIALKFKSQEKLADLEIELAQSQQKIKKDLLDKMRKEGKEETVQYAQKLAAYDNEQEKLNQLIVSRDMLGTSAAEYLELQKLLNAETATQNKHSIALLNFQLQREQLFYQGDKDKDLALARMASSVELQKLSYKHSEAQAGITAEITASVMRQDTLTGAKLEAEKQTEKHFKDKLTYLKLEQSYEEKLLKLKNAQNELTATGAQDVFNRVKAFKEGIKGGDTLADDLAAIGDASPIVKRIKELRTELGVQATQLEVSKRQKEAIDLIIEKEQERLELLKEQTAELKEAANIQPKTCAYPAHPGKLEAKLFNYDYDTTDYSSQVKARHPGSSWTQVSPHDKVLNMSEDEQKVLIKNLISQITPELAKFYTLRPELYPSNVTNMQGIHYGLNTNPKTGVQRGFGGGQSGNQIWLQKTAGIMTLIQEQMEVFLWRNDIDFGGADFGQVLTDTLQGLQLPQNWTELQANAYSGQLGSVPEEVFQRINETAIQNNTTWLEAFDTLPTALANVLLEAGVVRDMSNAAEAFNAGGLGQGKTAAEGLKFAHDLNAEDPKLLNGLTRDETSELNEWLVNENQARLDTMLMHWESYAERAGAVQFKSMGKAISYTQQLFNWEDTAREKQAAKKKKFDANFTKAEKDTTDYTQKLEQKKSDWAIEAQQEKMSAYAGTFGAIGSMMEKDSKAQQAFFALEKVMHTAKMAMMATELATTLGILPAKAVEAAVDGAAGDPNPYTKIATGLAIMAAMMALIGGVGGSSSSNTRTPAKKTERISSSATLETPTEQADSLRTALENIEEVEIKAFEQGWDVLYALRSIDDSMKQLSADIIKGIQAMGGIGTFSIGDMETVFGDWFGTTTSGHPGYFGGLFGGKTTSKTTELLGAGVNIIAQNLADVFDIDSGKVKSLQMKIWEKVKETTTTTKSGFLGFGGGTSTSTSTRVSERDFDNAAESSFAETLYDITHAVIDLGEQLGYSRSDLTDTLQGFQIAAQQIDLKDLAPDEQASAINAALSSIANDITLKIIPAVENWRHAGEEYLEALSRVYRDMLAFNQAFESIGRKTADFLSASGVEDILDWQQKLLSSKKGGFGDIGGLKDAFQKFSESIYSEGELAKFALDSAKDRVNTGLSELGLASDLAADDFRSWFEGKLGTGYFDDPDKLAIVIRLGEAFDDMTSSASDLEDAFGGIIDLIEEMKYGELSSLTQAQKYAHFKTEAETLARDAMAGDVKAGEKLAETMSKFVELSKDMFGGVGNFMNDRDWALKQLEDFKAKMGFAMGGIVAGGFRAFANGGMVNQPTLGLVGEGAYNEAIVPLPDGRSIPVMQTGNNPIVVELSKFREEQAELMRSAVTINSQESEEMREQLDDLKAEIIELRGSTEGFGNSVERVATSIDFGRA